MEQPTFETVVEQGKPIGRYGFRRDVAYMEQFRFWSANEFPAKLWRPRYRGHAVLLARIADVVIRPYHFLENQRVQSVIVDIDPDLHAYAESSDLQQRLYVGSLVVRQAVHDYLGGGLATSEQALKEFIAITSDQAYYEYLRQLGLAAA